jgi:hypothetical protein
MILGAWSSNPYLVGYPFLLGLAKLNLSLSDCYPFELAHICSFSMIEIQAMPTHATYNTTSGP